MSIRTICAIIFLIVGIITMIAGLIFTKPENRWPVFGVGVFIAVLSQLAFFVNIDAFN